MRGRSRMRARARALAHIISRRISIRSIWNFLGMIYWVITNPFEWKKMPFSQSYGYLNILPNPKTVKNVINFRKKFQWSWFFIFKLSLGVLNIPENFRSIGVAVPEIWYKRARARAIARLRQKNYIFRIFLFYVYRPQISPNTLVWFFMSLKTQKINFMGDILP